MRQRCPPLAEQCKGLLVARVMAILLVGAAAFTASILLLTAAANAAIKPCSDDHTHECTTVVSVPSGQHLHWRYSAGDPAQPLALLLRIGSIVDLVCW